MPACDRIESCGLSQDSPFPELGLFHSKYATTERERERDCHACLSSPRMTRDTGTFVKDFVKAQLKTASALCCNAKFFPSPTPCYNIKVAYYNSDLSLTKVNKAAMCFRKERNWLLSHATIQMLNG